MIQALTDPRIEHARRAYRAAWDAVDRAGRVSLGERQELLDVEEAAFQRLREAEGRGSVEAAG